MSYFKSLTESDLIALINSTNFQLFLCLPSIHKDLADAIVEKSRSNTDRQSIKINILIDYDAKTFRQGYGNSESVQKLFDNNIDVKSFDDNRISFIISDQVGYYLFFESRSIIPADKQTTNAIQIDPVSLVRLKKFFFSAEDQPHFEDELSNAIIEESKQLADPNNLIDFKKANVQIIDDEKVKTVVEDLKQNPPLNPDYKRIVDIYSSKFQYVKLKFDGANLQTRKIIIPKNALPIGDANLKDRIESKLNLFDEKKIDETFLPLQELKKRVTCVRDKYLKKVTSREESIIDRSEKENFVNEITSIKIIVQQTKADTVLNIAKHIDNTKVSLLENLKDFLTANPKILFPDNSLFQKDEQFVTIEAKTRAEKIIHRINWPRAQDLVEDFKLDVQYSDITFEDLKNEQFLKDLFKIGLIDNADQEKLATFSKGINI